MTHFFTSSILIGFLRLCFIVLFLFYLNRKWVKKENHVHFLDFIVGNWLRYGTLLVVLIFTLVQLNAYNLFNCYFILLFVMGLDTIGLKNLKHPKKFIKYHLKKTIINFIKSIENRKPLHYYLSIPSKDTVTKVENRMLFWIVLVVGATTFFSRYYFVIYDNYSLSDAWINDLYKVIQFDNQNWSDSDLSAVGELSLVNFYSKITGVSSFIALQVIAILESVILGVVLFWTIHKLTLSKYIAPVITALFFGLVYVLTPLNVYFILKGNPTFLALSFALPLFTFYAKPEVFKGNKKSFSIALFIGFLAIGLIDVFTYCILVPPFLLLGGLVTQIKNLKYLGFSIGAWLLATLTLFVIYDLSCKHQGISFGDFMASNLISIGTYTYVPQLIYPYKSIIYIAQVGTFIGFGLLVILALFKKTNWRIPFLFFTYFNTLVLMSNLHIKGLDIDLLNNAMSVFLPLVIGFLAAAVMTLFNLLFKGFESWSPISVPVIYICFIIIALQLQQTQLQKLTLSDETPKQLLTAYDEIAKQYFNHTYCVVNDPATQIISTNSHYFMNYDYFLNDYPRVDSIHYANRKDPNFIRLHPEFNISKSVMVFVLSENSKVEKNVFAENKHYQDKLVQTIKKLRKKGRSIQTIYSSSILHVYEIVNEPEQSKINDLIF